MRIFRYMYCLSVAGFDEEVLGDGNPLNGCIEQFRQEDIGNCVSTSVRAEIKINLHRGGRSNIASKFEKSSI